jgi:hypothetical protein
MRAPAASVPFLDAAHLKSAKHASAALPAGAHEATRNQPPEWIKRVSV